ncbi:outer membrane lipoprotein chaperone LolA [Bowmanella dokdonensis]|uniref:Outer-membrane lipoprotein carrier protein n=1 Tax=Bowmanella dokdonensis TaxID=751969 RepID=A0A939DLQ6_9ALTE|nr:outer membrane lipoprotein chaperone LolA [Bowmanella dokdonensis]MBN7824470.1 outer membrane lipoprotein chaperone LolA [Bowmanella dokdonensis]
MKKYFLIGLCLLGLQATANEAAESLKARLNNLHSYQAEFSQRVTDGQGETVQQGQGRLQLQQPNKLRWELYAPDNNILIADGQTVWHLDPFVEQAIAIDQQSAVQNNPLILLAEPDSHHWQDFEVSRLNGRYQITAKSDSSQIASLILTFDADKLVALTMLDRQQQTSELTFSQIQQNPDLSPALFEFSLPQGYELDDQRQVQTGSLNH